jgi:tetraprenyl-beta-curcumene synthase
MPDPLPLSPRQVWALLAAVARELLWGLRAASREIQTWRALALTIPDAAIREDALSSIELKRGHTDGAALFSILPRRRDRNLLRLLVTYEIIWDFLDCVNERGGAQGPANGRQLHLALVEALDPSVPISDYYQYHPWREDAGYLRQLVETCRACCVALPSYASVRQLVVGEARRAQVLALNHETDPSGRDAALRAWAACEFAGEERQFSWFELTGAASASMTVHAFLALAAQPACTEAEVKDTRAAYFPWLSAATTMLDSYVDQVEDAANGDHRYIAHYPSAVRAGERVQELVNRSAVKARRLENGHRHAVIAACMVAMYLSKDSARTPEMRASTASIVRAGGSLTRVLLPVLRLWRIAFAQCGA